jgi:hypothetical protein
MGGQSKPRLAAAARNRLARRVRRGSGTIGVRYAARNTTTRAAP